MFGPHLRSRNRPWGLMLYVEEEEEQEEEEEERNRT
jgi:hypothetical protein